MFVDFEKCFWGEKLNGFSVLHENFKLGLNSSKEFAEFLKERSTIEETYSKSLLRLAHKCSTVNSSVGTFEPCWHFLQASTEKLANVHTKIIANLVDVSKTVREYSEQQKDKQKLMKDEFTATNEAVVNLQNLTAALQKAKELYEQRSQDVEKCRNDFTSLKEIKNAESRFRKSCEEYRQFVDKRELARKEYDGKMRTIFEKLQAVEKNHLTQMLDILKKYGETIKIEQFLLDQIIEEFGQNMVALTVEKLLQKFIYMKQTGKDIPETIDFVEVDLKTKAVDIDAIAQAIKEEKKKRKSEKREKKLERKKKKEKANGSVEKASDETIEASALQLDAEGYVIRPVDTQSINSGKLSKGSYSSDSESDSDDDRQKIQVRIKPVDESEKDLNLSGEQLKKLSATITLKPANKPSTPQHEENKFVSIFSSHGSLDKLSKKSRSNNDLLNLHLDRSNADTGSLHSLPTDASLSAFPNNAPGQMSSSDKNIVASSAQSTPLNVVSSPNDRRDVVSLGSMSPSESFDMSAHPTKSLSMDEGFAAPPTNTETNNPLKAKYFANDLFDDPPAVQPTASQPPAKLPAALKAFDILKPPSKEKEKKTSVGSIPRPKPGQAKTLVARPAVAAEKPQSSLTDLLDINFSTPTLPPVVENETTEKPAVAATSDWINVEDSPLPKAKPPTTVSSDSLSPADLALAFGGASSLPKTLQGSADLFQTSPPSQPATDVEVSSANLMQPMAVSTPNTSMEDASGEYVDVKLNNENLPQQTKQDTEILQPVTTSPAADPHEKSLEGSRILQPTTSSPQVRLEPASSSDSSTILQPSVSANSSTILQPSVSANSTTVLQPSVSANSSTILQPSVSADSLTILQPSADSSVILKPRSVQQVAVAQHPDVLKPVSISPPPSSVDNKPPVNPTTPPELPARKKTSEAKPLQGVSTAAVGITPRLLSSDTLPQAIPKNNSSHDIRQLAPPSTGARSLSTGDAPQGQSIPIAVAFIETVNGVFKGGLQQNCVVKVTGDMTVSFSASMLSMLQTSQQPPPLSFLVTGSSSLEQIFPNKALVERQGQLAGGNGMLFTFNMPALTAYLKKQSGQGQASYYNIDIIKYQVRCSDAESCPLQMSAYWRCDSELTDLKIEYQVNKDCMSTPSSLTNVSAVVPVNGGVSIMQSKPTAIWSGEHQRCAWKIPSISPADGANALRARFDVTQGPSTPAPIAVQFTGEGATVSRLNFELSSPNYKLSLVKKRFASGKFIVEP